MARREIRTVEVTVDVDLNDFDDDVLVAELEERGYVLNKAADPLDPALESGISAYLSGKADHLREWARNFLQDRSYRCLP